jgi:hypothetical protein
VAEQNRNAKIDDTFFDFRYLGICGKETVGDYLPQPVRDLFCLHYLFRNLNIKMHSLLHLRL